MEALTPRPEPPRCPHCNGPVWLVAWAKKLPGYCFNQCPESAKKKETS